MKKNGFTLLELIIVAGIMGIIMLLFSPLLSSFIGAQNRLYNQSNIDSRVNEVVDFIKKDVRNAKSDSNLGGEPVGVFDEDDNLITDGSIGKKVIIYTTDYDGNRKYIQYTIDGNELKLKSDSGFSISKDGKNILSDVEVGEFRYKDKILLFYFKIDVPENLKGKIQSEIRDVGITHVNMN